MRVEARREPVEERAIAAVVPASSHADAAASSRPALLGRRPVLVGSLVVADLVALLGALAAAALLVRTDAGSAGEIALLAVLPLWLLGAYAYGLYQSDHARPGQPTTDELPQIFHLVTGATWLVFAGLTLSGTALVHAVNIVVFWAVAVVAIPALRATARGTVARKLARRERTIIVGAGDVGQLAARKLLQEPRYGLHLLGFVDVDPKELRADIEGVGLLGATDELPRLIDQLGVERVIIAFSRDRHEELLDLLTLLQQLRVRVDVVPRLFQALGPAVEVHSIQGLPLLGVQQTRPSRVSAGLTRAVELVGSAVALILAAPLFGLIALAIKLDSPGPIFFRQKRVGKDMQDFTMLKFRTMRTDADDRPHRDYIKQISSWDAQLSGNKLFKLERPDAVTTVGRIVRRTSLDELPQLLNVLRGDMALVGPRPCLAYELDTFEERHFQRFRVRPGITGLWQVTGRGNMTFHEALDIDVTYVFTRSLVFDFQLLLRTPGALLRKGTA